jgi:two-component system OmpR family response regulator
MKTHRRRRANANSFPDIVDQRNENRSGGFTPCMTPWGKSLLAPVIMLVEDEIWILLDVESALEDAGFEVLGFKDAADAIAKYEAAPATFAGLVTDIRLGSGLTGWDIARHVRRITPTLPVVYISGHGASQWRSQGVPGSVLIEKPFVMTGVITSLAHLMNQSFLSPHH